MGISNWTTKPLDAFVASKCDFKMVIVKPDIAMKKKEDGCLESIVVYINGDKICAASQGDKGSVRASISEYKINGEECKLSLSVGGFSSINKEYLTWAKRELKFGDEIVVVLDCLKIIDAPLETKTVEEMNALVRGFKANKNKVD